MKPLQDESLLRAWESGAVAGELARPAALLSVACPGTSGRHWLEASLPELVLQLLRLRHISFGPDLSGYLPCAHCGARLEFAMNLPQLIRQLEAGATETAGDLAFGEARYSMRQINLADLQAVGRVRDSSMARRALLQRCLAASGPQSWGDEFPGGDAFQTMALATFAKLHEGAELTGRAPCAECGQMQEFDLDIARFLWAEVRHYALRLLRDVHELASAYGWTESEILGLTPHRRNAYLEMARP